MRVQTALRLAWRDSRTAAAKFAFVVARCAVTALAIRVSTSAWVAATSYFSEGSWGKRKSNGVAWTSGWGWP